MDIEKYWNNKIIEWEDSMVKGKNVSLLERFASYFRKPLAYRSDICLRLLSPHVKGKNVLELGCGSGYFSFKLFEKARPKTITGIDISEEAIKRASKIAEDLYGNNNIFDFKTSDIIKPELPSSNITIGMGLLDYLTREEIAALFSRIKTSYFLFTFSERKLSVFRFIHFIYMKSQQCPKHYYYRKSDIKECYQTKFSGCQFINHPKLSFGCIVHNLPQSN